MRFENNNKLSFVALISKMSTVLLLVSLFGTTVFAASISDKYNDAIKQSELTVVQENTVSLSDITTHWAKANIENLVSRGGITGYPDGTFLPDKTISRAEFLKIAMLSVDNTISLEKVTEHWASGLLNEAYQRGIVRETEISMEDEDLNKQITRYEMARIMIRINESMQNEDKVFTTGVSNIITDYSKLPQTYRTYVEQSFMKGLITGYEDGSFGGDRTGTRAEATTMVVRLLEPASRVKVDTSKPVVVSDTVVIDGYTVLSKEKVKELTHKAFSTSKIYSENGKYYYSIDLGEPETGFKWLPVINVSNAKGKYLFSTPNRNVIGLKGKQVFELKDITQTDISNGAIITIGLAQVISAGNGVKSASYQIDSGMIGKIHESDSVANKTRWIPFENAAIFEGWK